MRDSLRELPTFGNQRRMERGQRPFNPPDGCKFQSHQQTQTIPAPLDYDEGDNSDA